MIKKALILLSFLPLLLHSPYLLQAWRSSRLDKLDWIFYLLTIPAALWAIRKEKIGKCDHFAWILLIPVSFLAFAYPLHHIHALSIAAAVGVIFAMTWLLASWSFAYRILPAAFILLLGTPSSSYQLSLLLMCPVWMAWAVKFLLAVLCFVLIWCNRRFALSVNKGTLFFTMALLGSVFLLMHTKEIYFEGKSFVPEFSNHIGNYWGRTLQPDENTQRFFATSTVRQYRYTKNDADISVLAVKCGKNIHEIHPASHCLRTGLWTIHSEKILYLQNNFAVTEIDAQKGENRILVWVWYSSDKFSTPGFLGFRRHFKANANYCTYQISIPSYGNIEQSRKEMQNFIKLLDKGSRK